MHTTKLVHSLLAVILLALLAVNPVLASSSSDPASQSAAAPPHITHAAHLRPSLEYGQEVLAFNSLVGKDIGLLMYFVPWGRDNGAGNIITIDPWLMWKLEAVPEARRPVLMLTWEPSQFSAGCNLGYGDGTGPLRSIISGRCDGYLRQFAAELKAHEERVLLRFAQEMNISDNTWNYSVFGHGADAPRLYKEAWRHFHNVLMAEGVTNVEFVWSPNWASNPPPTVPGYEWNDLHNYYPGDEYVDWIGLSGYNWYGYRSGAQWDCFQHLYDQVLADLACRYPKPQILAEVGSTDGPGTPQTKADWIGELYSNAQAHPFVRAISWFNDFAYENPSDADFRITTSSMHAGSVQPLPGWTDAYRAAIADDIFVSKLPTLEEATPPQVFCRDTMELPAITLTPDYFMAEPGDVLNVNITAFGLEQAASIVVGAPVAQAAGGVQGGMDTVVVPNTLDSYWDTATVQVTLAPDLVPGTYELPVTIGGEDYIVTIVVITNLQRVYIPLAAKQ